MSHEPFGRLTPRCKFAFDLYQVDNVYQVDSFDRPVLTSTQAGRSKHMANLVLR